MSCISHIHRSTRTAFVRATSLITIMTNIVRSKLCTHLPYKCRVRAIFPTQTVRMSGEAVQQLVNPAKPKTAASIYEFSARNINGEVVPLEKYRGHVCIIVNVASQCGYAANHYEELVQLHEQLGESKGLKILAFPCNQFGNQESGDAQGICSFVAKKNVKFDMFEKINVNGNDAHPLYTYLKYKQGGTLGSFIKWNFTKFVVDKNGQPVERYGPGTSPKQLTSVLEKYL